MSKRTETSVVKVGDAPAWLLDHAGQDTSFKEAEEYRILPRLRIVQNTHPKVIRDTLGEGTAALFPSNSVVAAEGSPFQIVPVMFYKEFILWNDRKDKSSPAIAERTFDKDSALAARARDFKRMYEPYGDPSVGFKQRFCEQLVFPSIIYGDHPLSGTVASLLFTRGEFKVGRDLLNSMMMRKVSGQIVPIWAQVWELLSAGREKEGNSWYGFDYRNPTSGEAYIPQNLVEGMREEHARLTDLFNKRRLSVDMSDADDERGGDTENIGNLD